MTTTRVRNSVVVGGLVASLLVNGCQRGANDSDPAVATRALTDAPSTSACVADIQKQVDRALAAFEEPADADREAVQALQDLDVEGCPEWDGAAAAAALETEAANVLAQTQASPGELDPDTYGTLTGLALVAAALRPAPTYAVPQGFPPEFPVVDGAEVVDSAQDGNAISARWRVEDTKYQDVYAFYETELQTMVPGRWSASGISGGVMQGAGSVVSGNERFEVTGYGLSGTVNIIKEEGNDVITVQADLAPEE